MADEQTVVVEDRKTESATPAEQSTADKFYADKPVETKTESAATPVKEETKAEPVVDPAKVTTEPEKKVEEKKDETKKEEDKKVEEKAAVVTEVKFDLKLPEGTLLSSERVKEIETFAKANKFSNEQAQKILDGEHEVVAEFQENQLEQAKQVNLQWQNQNREDKEFGGDNLKSTMAASERVLKTFAPELIPELEKSGLGNHPAFFKFMGRLGKATASDKLVLGGSGNSRPAKSTADVFYTPTEENKT